MSLRLQSNSNLGLGLNLHSLSSIKRVDGQQIRTSDHSQTNLPHLALLLSLELGEILALLVLVDGFLDVVQNQVHELIPALQCTFDLSASDFDNHPLVFESRQIQNGLSLGELELLVVLVALVLTLVLTLSLLTLVLVLVLMLLLLLILVLVVSSMMASVAMTSSATSSLLLVWVCVCLISSTHSSTVVVSVHF